MREFARRQVRHGTHAGFLARVERRLGNETLVGGLRDERLHTRGGLVARAVELVAERGGEQQRGQFQLGRFAERVAAGEVDGVGARLARLVPVELHGGGPFCLVLGEKKSGEKTGPGFAPAAAGEIGVEPIMPK